MVSAFLIIIILLQQGKGADVGATFGGGGNTLFGAAGADNLLTKVTAFASFAFMATSVLLALGQKPSVASQGDIFKNIPTEAPAEEDVIKTIDATDESAVKDALSEGSSSDEADSSKQISEATSETPSGEITNVTEAVNAETEDAAAKINLPKRKDFDLTNKAKEAAEQAASE